MHGARAHAAQRQIISMIYVINLRTYDHPHSLSIKCKPIHCRSFFSCCSSSPLSRSCGSKEFVDSEILANLSKRMRGLRWIGDFHFSKIIFFFNFECFHALATFHWQIDTSRRDVNPFDSESPNHWFAIWTEFNGMFEVLGCLTLNVWRRRALVWDRNRMSK